MVKKFIATALAVLAFVPVPRSNAGTEIVEPYNNAPAPNYNYAPPPPVYYGYGYWVTNVLVESCR